MTPSLSFVAKSSKSARMDHELGIIGAGNMAEAIARGVMQSGLFRANQIIAADVSTARRELFENQLGIHAIEDNAEAARGAKVILLSVKPQHMAAVLAGMSGAIVGDPLIISIAAGISSRFIEEHLGTGRKWRVVRSMPNTPMLVGEGMVAIARGSHASEADMNSARKIFESAATVIELAEDKMDTVTAMSGSGPAYFFFLVEHMIQAGIELGLTPEQARQLASRTALGAAKMLETSSDSPQELRRKVTSPGGTTHAAITHMESKQVGPAIVEAIKAAERRGKELGK